MRKSKYTEEQIVPALKQADAGIKVEDACRKLGITQTNFYRWKVKFSGMEVSEAKRLKQLELEDRQAIRRNSDTAVLLAWTASQAHWSPISRLPQKLGRAQGTSTTTTPWSRP